MATAKMVDDIASVVPVVGVWLTTTPTGGHGSQYRGSVWFAPYSAPQERISALVLH